MESIIRGACIYAVLLVVVRLSGRRTLGEMNPFDLVLLMIIAETTQQALLGDDFSLANAVVLILTLFSIDIALSYVKRGFPRAELLLDGAPLLLVSHGRVDHLALRKTRIGLEDILEAARDKQGIGSLEQVRFAVLETTGQISIIPESNPEADPEAKPESGER